MRWHITISGVGWLGASQQANLELVETGTFENAGHAHKAVTSK